MDGSGVVETITELITKGSSPKWQGVSYTDNSNDVLFITSENVGSFKILLDSAKYVEKNSMRLNQDQY
jgi:type I restriction enzyme S subunit